MFAPVQAGLCDWCGQALRDVAVEAPRLGLRAAAVRLERACSCGSSTPIDALPADRTVSCGFCGQTEALSDADWRRVLHAVHAVADLVADHPEGFEPSPVAIDEINPYGEAARTGGVVRVGHDDSGAPELPGGLRLTVAPGVPLDPEDGEPRSVEAVGAGVLRVSGAAGAHRYGVPAVQVQACPTLAGVIAPDHEIDPAEPELVVEGGVWRCPDCAAGLARTDGSRYRLRCGACGTVSRVPAAVRYRKVRSARPETAWMLFVGPSAERRRLERADGPGPGDRPLEHTPLAGQTAGGRALWALYVVGVPLVLLAVAGVVGHGATVWDAAAAVLGP